MQQRNAKNVQNISLNPCSTYKNRTSQCIIMCIMSIHCFKTHCNAVIAPKPTHIMPLSLLLFLFIHITVNITRLHTFPNYLFLFELQSSLFFFNPLCNLRTISQPPQHIIEMVILLCIYIIHASYLVYVVRCLFSS